MTRTDGAVSRLRGALGATQSEVAKKAGIDQSRLSRIEKGEVVATEEIKRVLDALVALGSSEAAEFARFMDREWRFIEPPSFWNPERASLEPAEETLEKIEGFLRKRRAALATAPTIGTQKGRPSSRSKLPSGPES